MDARASSERVYKDCVSFHSLICYSALDQATPSKKMAGRILKVCAVVDSVGYEIGSEYHIRELAIANNDGKKTFEFQTDLMVDENHATVFGQYFHHGLKPVSDNSCPYNSSEANSVLCELYDGYSNWSQYAFGVSNPFLKRILQDSGIPHVDLQQAPFYYHWEKYSGMWDCGIHYNESAGRRPIECALRFVANMWEYVDTQQMIDVIDLNERDDVVDVCDCDAWHDWY